MDKSSLIAANQAEAETILRDLGAWNPDEHQREQGLTAWRDMFVRLDIPVTEDTILAAQAAAMTVHFQVSHAVREGRLPDGPAAVYSLAMLSATVYGSANLLATEGDAAAVKDLLNTLDFPAEGP